MRFQTLTLSRYAVSEVPRESFSLSLLLQALESKYLSDSAFPLPQN